MDIFLDISKPLNLNFYDIHLGSFSLVALWLQKRSK